MKNRQIKRAFSLIMLVFILASSLLIFPASAASEPTPPTPENCRAACLYNKTHNKMLLMTNEETQLSTSTSAKVTMGLVACEMLKDRLDEKVTITASMLQGENNYASKMDPPLAVGEEIKIKDLLYGAICGSRNDAGYAIASICAVSYQEFAKLMTDRAKSLGATSTKYTNPLGYPDNSSMVTTLADTLKIAVAASENELYMEISSAKSHNIPATNLSGARTVYNRNYLISSRSTTAYYNAACSGMNAGISSDEAGWSIITLARDEGIEYICIVLGGSESEDGSQIYAYETANKLIKWACSTYNMQKIYDKGTVVGKAEVGMTALGSAKVDCVTLEDLNIYITKQSNPDISYHIEYDTEKLVAPIKAGERIGVVKVYSDGQLVGECPVALTKDCESNGVMQAIAAVGNYTKSRAFIAALIIFVILLPVVLYFSTKGQRHRGKYRRY